MPHAFSLELRKLLSYRADFWVHQFGTLLAEVALAYFLWKAMFAAQGVTEMGGYGFRGMMLYYLLVPLVARMVRGEEQRFLSDDIYEGGLTRYLVYPLSFLQYKYVSLLVLSFVSVCQLGIALLVFGAAFGFPPEIHLSAVSLAMGLGTAAAASLLHFFMAGSLEMASFWVDSVWNLMAMMRMTLTLLGGGLIPLTLFPAWAQRSLGYLPFGSIISFPIRCFLGQVSGLEWLRGMAVIFVWMLVFGFVARLAWSRGTRQYSGVGL
jgi:ABC-2 type transport system permease protein